MTCVALRSRKLCPVSVAISASEQPTNASRVTAVPRKSLKVTPSMCALADAFPHDARKPFWVHGLPSELSKIVGLRLWRHGYLAYICHVKFRVRLLVLIAAAGPP